MFKKSQIWIETVIYTLIGLAIIGVLLSLVKPAIEEKKDQLLLDKSLEMIEIIQDKVEEVVYYGTGNSRIVEIRIKKGQLEIDAVNEKIEFLMESSYMYSELGKNVSIGDINATTIKKGKLYDVKLSLNYNNLNLTSNRKDKRQVFQKAPTPYKITITNLGKNMSIAEDKIQVDFS